MSDMQYTNLTAEAACAALTPAGLRLDPQDLRIEPREERWLAKMPGGRLAWFARSQAGAQALATERRVLKLLAARCAFAAPRVVYEAPDGQVDVRTVVPGRDDPWVLYDAVVRDAAFARRLGAEIGAVLAELHTRVTPADVAAWLPAKPSWPEAREWVRERLPSVVADADLRARADAVMAAYESVAVDPADLVLAHTDVGFHNLAIDAGTHAVNGLFDYDGAACADRHHDFRYLVLDYERDELLEGALAAYEPAVGRTIDRARVVLYNAACAVTYLAFRSGHAPEERWCGRTLEEDLRWSRLAIARALGS